MLGGRYGVRHHLPRGDTGHKKHSSTVCLNLSGFIFLLLLCHLSTTRRGSQISNMVKQDAASVPVLAT